MRQPDGFWNRWETVELLFAAAALLLPAYLPWPRAASAVAAALAFAGAAAVTCSRPFADGLGVDRTPRWPVSSRTAAAVGLWVIGVVAAGTAAGLPQVPTAYVTPRQAGRAVLVGALAPLLFGNLIGSALWRWTLARRARRFSPEAQRRARRLLSQHERGVLTSDELRAAWKELSVQRRRA